MIGIEEFVMLFYVSLLCLVLNFDAKYGKVDSDSEINWDEDEDLGDTEIPGILLIFLTYDHRKLSLVKLSLILYQYLKNLLYNFNLI